MVLNDQVAQSQPLQQEMAAGKPSPLPPHQMKQSLGWEPGISSSLSWVQCWQLLLPSCCSGRKAKRISKGWFWVTELAGLWKTHPTLRLLMWNTKLQPFKLFFMEYSAACNWGYSINTDPGQETWLFEDVHMVKTEVATSVNRGHCFNSIVMTRWLGCSPQSKLIWNLFDNHAEETELLVTWRPKGIPFLFCFPCFYHLLTQSQHWTSRSKQKRVQCAYGSGAKQEEEAAEGSAVVLFSFSLRHSPLLCCPVRWSQQEGLALNYRFASARVRPSYSKK